MLTADIRTPIIDDTTSDLCKYTWDRSPGIITDQTDTRPPLTKPISGQCCGTQPEKSVACIVCTTHLTELRVGLYSVCECVMCRYSTFRIKLIPDRP
ncbi:hypothetical protein J6590_090634 [Homalodisca vitripennis]|nr:hypothetical protein J6590_090634 [Homalodisca vitripennis]